MRIVFSLIALSWPVIAWFVLRTVAAEMTAATSYHRAATAGAPVLLAVVALAAKNVPTLISAGSSLILLAGSMLSGGLGLYEEYDRLAPTFGLASVTPMFILQSLDYPLIVASLAAILVPIAPLLQLGELRSGAPRAKGGAAFMPVRVAASKFSRGDIVFGEAYDPKYRLPRPGHAPLLRFEGSEHLLTVGGAGTGKTTTIAIPNCLTWRGPLVALDPKGELAHKCRAVREAMGHDVLVLDPSDDDSDAINVLDSLDPSSDRVVSQVAAVVTWLTGGKRLEGDNAVFESDARGLIQGLLLDLICDPTIPRNQKTLRELCDRINGNVANYLSAMELKPPLHGFGIPKKTAARMLSMQIDAPEQWQGVIAHAGMMTDWLKNPRYARLVSGEGRRVRPIRELLRGNLDVFVAIPLRDLDAQPEVARTVLGALLNTIYEEFEKRKSIATRVLFLLDEMPRLGKMEIIQTARDAGRGLGVTLWAIVQDLGQLDQCYGKDGAKGWIESTWMMNFLSVRHPETAEFVSSMIGDARFESRTKNENRVGGSGALWDQVSRGTSVAHEERRLMPPHEVMRLRTDSNGRPDEQLIFIRNERPIRCGVAKHYLRPEWEQIFDRVQNLIRV